MTILHRLKKWALEGPDMIAQRYKVKGEWKEITAKDYYQRVVRIALWIKSLSKGDSLDRVSCIFSYNRPEWVHCDLAFMLSGERSAGLYPNASYRDVTYVLEHTNCHILVVENESYFNKAFKECNNQVPDYIEKIIVLEGNIDFHPKCISYEEVLIAGEKLFDEESEKKLFEIISPNREAFLIYTSGTTGNPKGATLTHDNLTYAVDIAGTHWGLKKGKGVTFSFLPLCHIAEKLQNVGAGISYQLRTDYCSGFDNIASDLAEVRPTLLLCVPRLWEKMYEGVTSKMSEAKGVKKILATFAMSTANEYIDFKVKTSHSQLPLILKVKYSLAEKLVLGKIKKALGIDRVEMAASGAASLSAHVSKWFSSLGVDILEVYGQTESTGIICMTRLGEESYGSVGVGVEGTEFKIADDGELLTRGRHVFKGYHLDESATKEVLNDGWLHSGDLGKINDKGLVQIIGRKKEIMKTSGGKMVAPVKIEEMVKQHKYVSQACLVGDGRKYFSMLITLAENIEISSVLEKEIENFINSVNSKLARFEQVKYFKVLDRDFSIESGELTPTMKMKRAVIENNFKAEIDSFYLS